LPGLSGAVSVGLYGKLPCQGDFVSRRLPWEFTSGWDDWLQAGIARARLDIGSGWNSTYLTAPLWRFQLAPGVLGSQGWIGLWFASVDRVGRQFPLALVEPLPTHWQGRYAVIEHDHAFVALEDAGLQGLDPRLAFDAFDQTLERLSLQDEAARAALLVPQALSLQAVEIDIDQIGARRLRLPPDADVPAVLSAAQAAGTPESCFFTWGNEHHPPMLYRCSGLVPDTEFRGFLDGRWS
jgi:type VI secretion system protein ImpM